MSAIDSQFALAPRRYLFWHADHAGRHARAINPAITVIALSAVTGEARNTWCEWLRREVGALRRLT